MFNTLINTEHENSEEHYKLKKTEKIAKKNKKAAIGLAIVACTMVAFIIVLNFIIIPNGKYDDAVELMNAQKYTEAISAFKALDGYKDSAEKINECNTAIKDDKYAEAMALMELGKYEEAITAFSVIGNHRDCKSKIDACKNAIKDNEYDNAVALMNAGKYEEAISAFNLLDGHNDSANKIIECENIILNAKYDNACVLMDAGQYEEAITAFELLDSYKDSTSKITECKNAIIERENEILRQKYENAVKLMGEEKYKEAKAAFEQIVTYSDSKTKISQCEILHTKQKLRNTNVGQYVVFGRYEQDENLSNGKEEIEWRVLAKDNSRILVVSKYALDCKPVQETLYYGYTWDGSSIRIWLNNEFIDAAFTSDEKKMIPTVKVTAEKNPHKYYKTNPGKDTQDKVFLLSMSEAKKYFANDTDRKCKPTDYAWANGATYGGTSWWLRTSGQTAGHMTFVGKEGYIEDFGVDGMMKMYYAIRPAMWIDMN